MLGSAAEWVGRLASLEERKDRMAKQTKKPEELKEKKEPYLYIAAPFFNSAQIRFCENLQRELEARELRAFFPFRDSRIDPPITDLSAKQAFQENINGIERATHVLAILDWFLPPGHHIGEWDDEILGWAKSHLNIPDSGVCFEMGVADTYGIPIIGYLETPKSANLMLAMTCVGLIREFDSLREWLYDPNNFDLLQQWSGGLF